MLHAPWVAGGQGKLGRLHKSALCALTVVRLVRRKRAPLSSRAMGKGKGKEEYDDCVRTMAWFLSFLGQLGLTYVNG